MTAYCDMEMAMYAQPKVTSQAALSNIWVVDNSTSSLKAVSGTLASEGHGCVIFHDPMDALEQLALHKIALQMPSVILIDHDMQQMESVGFLDRAFMIDPTQPVVLMTAKPGLSSTLRVYKAKAFDFLPKPIKRENLMMVIHRVAMFSELRAKQHVMEDALLQVQASHARLRETALGLIRGIAKGSAATQLHYRRVGEYAMLLAEHIGQGREFCEAIQLASQLHDCAGIFVRDQWIPEDGQKVTLCDSAGADEMEPAACSPLKMAAEIVHWRHERWDGSGYPSGLKELRIPLAARIVALVDKYDSLRVGPEGSAGLSHNEACRVLLLGDGDTLPSHFDPSLLEALKQINCCFEHIFSSADGKDYTAKDTCHRPEPANIWAVLGLYSDIFQVK